MCYKAVMGPTPLELTRRLLVDLLRGEGNGHGSKKRIAELIGVHQSTLTRLVDGTTGAVSERLIESICQRTGIRPAYFYDNPEGRPALAFVTTPLLGENWAERSLLKHAALTLLLAVVENGDQATGEAPPEAVAKAVSAVFHESPQHMQMALAAALELPGHVRQMASPLGRPSAADLGKALAAAAEGGGDLVSKEDAQRYTRALELLTAAEESREHD